MRCTHCQHDISVNCFFTGVDIQNEDGHHALAAYQCPNCRGAIVDLLLGDGAPQTVGFLQNVARGLPNIKKTVRLYPRTASRPPAPPEVPTPYSTDYNEAALILTDSPKASAALSRRCLQHVLQNELKISKRNLAEEIEEAIKVLPSYVGDGLDEVRKIGNFAAHPKKSEASGEILEVEPGEAEWSLEVLDMLFDHVFIGPAKKAARKAALDAKLKPATP